MRLRRLDLTRFGKFTDRSFDFGARGEGAPDLHILYGPNEAGKSTLLAGWLDLLYGIPAQSRHDFLHPYSAMRIGACIEIDGRLAEVVRTKGRANTLTGPDGAPLPGTLLQAGLGGIGRAAYQAMFSLDDDTLEAGGESILASEGDLGQLLFSASAGLADLSAGLEALRARCDAFHRPGARKTGLAALKAELRALEEARAGIDTQASAFARLTEMLKQAEAAWAAARDAQSATAAELDRVRRHLSALGPVARLRRLDAELAPLAGLPAPPDDWAGALPQLLTRQAETAARLEEVAGTCARLGAQRDAAVPDPAVLAARDPIAAAARLLAGCRAAGEKAAQPTFERLLKIGAVSIVPPDE